MKPLIFCLLLFAARTTFCQQTGSTPLSAPDGYLQKSKNQKGVAWVLLGGGAALIAGGFLVGDRRESSFDDAATGGVMGAIGVLSTIGSIPLFIASARNKRKAAATAFIELEKSPLPFRLSLRTAVFPAIGVKISL